MRWDIFCKVIDNLGDIGVCWRLSTQLAARGHTVRLWMDEPAALGWMAPLGCPGVEVRVWRGPAMGEPGDVVIEAFGCSLDDDFVAAMAARRPPPRWINLEYLSAQDYVARFHGLASPVLSGPGAGLRKHFFYPGFSAGSGGLLREHDLDRRQASFDRGAWLHSRGIEWKAETLVSLFCYEPPALANLLRLLASQATPVRLLVTAGRATAAVRSTLQGAAPPPGLGVCFLPFLSQHDYDHLLWACDLNFVRGEDSLVRALWAKVPFVWQIYPQDDGAHMEKLEAFLTWLAPPGSMADFHRKWNVPVAATLAGPDLPAWGVAAAAAGERLKQQPDLVSQLLGFMRESG